MHNNEGERGELDGEKCNVCILLFKGQSTVLVFF